MSITPAYFRPVQELDNVMMIKESEPVNSISFYADGNREVGRLDLSGPTMKFSGDVEASAKIFFEYVATLWADEVATRVAGLAQTDPPGEGEGE